LFPCFCIFYKYFFPLPPYAYPHINLLTPLFRFLTSITRRGREVRNRRRMRGRSLDRVRVSVIAREFRDFHLGFWLSRLKPFT
jgi:hypothetical protein